MEKVRPWCGQISDRGRLKNRTEHVIFSHSFSFQCRYAVFISTINTCSYFSSLSSSSEQLINFDLSIARLAPQLHNPEIAGNISEGIQFYYGRVIRLSTQLWRTWTWCIVGRCCCSILAASLHGFLLLSLS